MSGDQHILTEAEIEDIVERGARRAIRGTLISLGVDADNPLETQQDFAALRDWRTTMTAIRSRGLKTVVAVLVTGLLAALWVGIKSYFPHSAP